MRPHVSARAPTSIATGTITVCAATMHAAIRLVPTSLLTQRQLLPDQRQHGRVGEMEQTAAAAKISSGRLASSTRKAGWRRRGRAPRRTSSPRATSLSMASAGIDERDGDARDRQRRHQPEHHDRPEQVSGDRGDGGGAALPAWLKPHCGRCAGQTPAGPTMPSVIADIAGAKHASPLHSSAR